MTFGYSKPFIRKLYSCDICNKMRKIWLQIDKILKSGKMIFKHHYYIDKLVIFDDGKRIDHADLCEDCAKIQDGYKIYRIYDTKTNGRINKRVKWTNPIYEKTGIIPNYEISNMFCEYEILEENIKMGENKI